MSFLKATPDFVKGVQSLETQNELVEQLWNQLGILRHLGRASGLNASKAMVPWLNQAEYYYLDAKRSRWRSSGLLYYYSFLNLAKAYLVGKRSLTVATMKSTSIYHGLHSDPQSPPDITKFEVKIMPPLVNGRVNIFSAFYEKYTGTKWPFASQVSVRLSDIFGYSTSIASELEALHGIKPAMILAQGSIRTDQANASTWYEMCVDASSSGNLMNEFSGGQFSLVPGSSLSKFDRADWFASYQKTNFQINRCAFIQSLKHSINNTNQNQVTHAMMQSVSKDLQKYILPYPQRRADESWTFFPKVLINGQRIHWFPLLTDYIVAFALSTILRYHPHLLLDDDRDSYIARAWSSQSSIDALRYFVMLFSDPMVVLN